MRHSAFRLLAAASLLAPAWRLEAARRPHYGGTLRVEWRGERALEPAEWPMAFETLVELDDTGRARPALALSWRRDAASKRWQFHIRPNVTLHNGAPLTAQAAAAAMDGNGWVAVALGEEVVVQCEAPTPLAAFAGARHAVAVRTAEGALVGTGPFRIVQAQPRRVTFAAHEEYWAGRPFLDGLVVETGRTAPQELLDLEAGKADLVELGPGEVRRASQSGARIWNSAPVTLMALVFDPGRPAAAASREALALSIDRSAILSVILQKQGEAAGGLLPRWVSGYAMLFPAARDLERSRQLAGSAAALSLAYDPADALARMVAERVAVNAREAGVRVTTQPGGAADARLVRVRIAPPVPEWALDRVCAALGVPLTPWRPGMALSALYASEARALEDYRVIPLFHLPLIFASGAALKTWSSPGLLRTGQWRWEDLWLDPRTP